MNEMTKLGFDGWDVLEILKEGYDCSASRRREGILERCMDKGRKTVKVVTVKSYNWSLESDVWVITHVGRFTRKR